jgi:BolA protein
MSRNQERIALFLADLKAALPIDQIAIEDESHLHAGHAGAASGGGHFKLTLVSSAFDGLNRVARHRLIYTALNRHIPTEIHALTIEAHSPAEALLLK